MKLIQVNIWGGRLEGVLKDFMAAEKPDLVCMQEVIDIEGDGALCVPLEELRKKGGLTEAFHSPVFTFGMMGKSAHFGNAIMSKAPFVAQETIFTNLTYSPDFSFDSDDYNIRNLQHAIIEKDGQPLHILNHHGHHVQEHKNGNADTLRQMKQISEYMKTLDGSIILTGDFNLAPHSESLEIINTTLENLCITHKLTTTRTSLTHKTEVCDYIFVSPDIGVRSFHTSDEIVSDHQALILEF